MVFVKQNIVNGTPGDASQINHAETQYDEAVADLAAGTIPVKATALTGTIATARMPEQRRSIWLSAAGGTPTTTNGCAPPSKVELPTNDLMLVTLDFDPNEQEHATWMFVMPDGWETSNMALTAQIYWTAAGGTAGNRVWWGIRGRSYGYGESLDQALGQPTEKDSAFVSATTVHRLAMDSPVTLAGTPAPGEVVVIKVYRCAELPTDSLPVDAKLIGVLLEFQAKYSD